MVLFSVVTLMTAFGALAWLAVSVMLGAMGLAFCHTLLCGLLLRHRRWLLWLPVTAGILGLVLCLAFFNVEPVIFWVFWGLFLLAALMGYGVSRFLKRLFRYLADWVGSEQV